MTDKEIVDAIRNVYARQIKTDIPNFRKEYEGQFAEGYIESMLTNAEFIVNYIDTKRKENRRD